MQRLLKEFPLLEAAASLAQDEYPALDMQEVLDEVDQLLARLTRRVTTHAPAVQRLQALNRFFYGDLGFGGNLNHYYDPSNSNLAAVLRTRRGIPISLAVLWMELAQGIGLQVQGVAFPGHFLVKALLPEGQALLDPFNGHSLTLGELEERLEPFQPQGAQQHPQESMPLALYQQPANRFVATFIGSPTINLLPARVIEVSDAGARLQLGNGSKVLATVDASQLQVGETVEVGLRPEHCEVLPAGVAPAADDTALDAEITLVEHLGESNLLYLKMDDGQELIVRGDGNAEVRLGDSVIVRAAPSALYLFKADGAACTRLNPGNMRSAHAR